MEQMDQDNIKIEKKISIDTKVIIEKIKSYWQKPLVKLSIAMIMILIVIAILLIQDVVKKTNADDVTLKVNGNSEFIETYDERLIVFIKNYFKARNYLDFVNIYRAFNKDYMLIKDDEESKKCENGILYEKNYVKGFDNIKVYEHPGINQNEKVVLISYDMQFYFSNGNAPSMLISYIVDDGKKMYFKENFDIGETKYINSLIETNQVKKIYKEIEDRLELALTNDNNLKLAYNSLRQYDMNPNNNVLDDRDMLINKIFGNEKTKEKELIDLARKKEALQ